MSPERGQAEPGISRIRRQHRKSITDSGVRAADLAPQRRKDVARRIGLHRDVPVVEVVVYEPTQHDNILNSDPRLRRSDEIVQSTL